MATKIAVIGAGAQKFVRQFVIDLLQFEAMHDVRLALMDIDAARLERAAAVVRKVGQAFNAPITVEPTTDQRRAVDGADHVLVTFMVGGMKHYASDTFIPERHGVSIAAGDTIGPGAVMRLLRSAGPLRALTDNLRETAPDALVVNYANPMSMIVSLLREFGCRRVIGLCHSAFSAVQSIGEWLDVDPDAIEFTIGGLNHLNFLLRLEHEGRDLYPRLLAEADRIVRDARAWEADTGRREARGYERVRMEITRYLDYFPLEGPWHQGEYYPWFRKNPALAEHYGPPTGWAYRFDKKLAELGDAETDEILAGRQPIDRTPRGELGAPIIHALQTGASRPVVVNVPNEPGLVDNLPRDAAVEVRGRVDGHGIHPDRVGRIPTQLAGIMHQHYTVHRLAIEGILAKDRTRLRQAIQADPLTAAVLTLPQIEKLTDELLAENAAYLQDWP